MTTLSSSDAKVLVRKNLDELDPNGSIMYDTDNAYGDNESLDNTITRMLPEAINAVHLTAPVQLLEGETASFKENAAPNIYNYYDSDAASPTYGMLHLQLADEAKFLRLVAFQAVDSPIVVTEIVPESSAEGRKQVNKYIRGRYDRPRLVQLQGVHTSPQFNYHSLKADTITASPAPAATACVKQCVYIKEQFYIAPTEQTPNPSYNISRRLRQNIIDCLTAMVMETYNDQRAQLYYQKANNYANI